MGRGLSFARRRPRSALHRLAEWQDGKLTLVNREAYLVGDPSVWLMDGSKDAHSPCRTIRYERYAIGSFFSDARRTTLHEGPTKGTAFLTILLNPTDPPIGAANPRGSASSHPDGTPYSHSQLRRTIREERSLCAMDKDLATTTFFSEVRLCSLHGISIVGSPASG